MRCLTYIGFFVILVSLSTCSPAARYRILSTAFDGVPNPTQVDPALTDSSLADSESADTLSSGGPIASKPSSYRHEVYSRRTCDSCHDKTTGNSLVDPEPTLCYNCHDDFAESNRVLHGPVASGYCTQCHSPHRAPFEHLLLREGRELCQTCHNPADILTNNAHEGEEDSSCIDCHSPHGGDDQYLF